MLACYVKWNGRKRRVAGYGQRPCFIPGTMSSKGTVWPDQIGLRAVLVDSTWLGRQRYTLYLQYVWNFLFHFRPLNLSWKILSFLIQRSIKYPNFSEDYPGLSERKPTSFPAKRSQEIREYTFFQRTFWVQGFGRLLSHDFTKFCHQIGCASQLER
jgi:hypothetical protein